MQHDAATVADGGGSDSSVDAPAPTGAAYRIMAPPKLGANPSVRNRVIVVGTQADGTPATDAMVLNFDRPGAGTYDRPAVTLGPLGASSYFYPCDVATPGCVGPLRLTAAFASAPTTPVATLDVEIVDPIEVNPAKDCLGGGNVLHLKGNDQIFNGDTTFTNATWAFDSQYNEYLIVRVTPQAATDSWRLTFDTRVYSNYMIPDVYENAQKSISIAAVLKVDYPAMDISGFGHQCNMITGSFEVVDYFVGGNGVQRATYAFEQHCEGSTTTVLTGCIHYQQP